MGILSYRNTAVRGKAKGEEESIRLTNHPLQVRDRHGCFRKEQAFVSKLNCYP